MKKGGASRRRSKKRAGSGQESELSRKLKKYIISYVAPAPAAKPRKKKAKPLRRRKPRAKAARKLHTRHSGAGVKRIKAKASHKATGARHKKPRVSHKKVGMKYKSAGVRHKRHKARTRVRRRHAGKLRKTRKMQKIRRKPAGKAGKRVKAKKAGMKMRLMRKNTMAKKTKRKKRGMLKMKKKGKLEILRKKRERKSEMLRKAKLKRLEDIKKGRIKRIEVLKRKRQKELESMKKARVKKFKRAKDKRKRKELIKLEKIRKARRIKALRKAGKIQSAKAARKAKKIKALEDRKNKLAAKEKKSAAAKKEKAAAAKIKKTMAAEIKKTAAAKAKKTAKAEKPGKKTGRAKENEEVSYFKTDIPGFDSLLKNGIPPASSVLIEGGPGSGKTIFCLQTAYNACRQGKKVLYMSFEEPEERLRKHMRNFGWDTTPFEKKGTFMIKRFDALDIARSVEALLSEAKKELLIDVQPILIPAKFKPDVILVDSLTSIASAFSGEESRFRIYMEQLFRYLEYSKITSFLIREVSNPTHIGKNFVEKYEAVSFLSDGIIILYSIAYPNGTRGSAVEVLKMRGSSINKKIVRMDITGRGLTVHPDVLIKGDIEFT